jgi:RNA polymerase sigma factor for flagellar operon FliA
MGVSAALGDLWTEFIETRSPELRAELINKYAPLARFIVGRLGIPPSSLLDAEDLVSYGIIGLINAVDRYDPARGVRFESFATPRIRGAVIDQLRQLNWLPRAAVSRVRQIENTLAELEQHLGRPSTEEEAANALGVSTDRYRQMLQEVSATILSLDAPLGSLMQEDEQASLSDLLEDHNALEPLAYVEREELTQALATAIEHLPEREQLLLSLYYKEELTMKEISKIMSVSESRVCQLHMQAIMRLRGTLYMYHTGETRTQEVKGAERPKVMAGRTNTTQRTQRHHPLNDKHTDDSEVVTGGGVGLR